MQPGEKMRRFNYLQDKSVAVRAFFWLGVGWVGLQAGLFAVGWEPDPPRRDAGVVSVRGTSGRVGYGGWRFFGDGFSGGK